jgi:hypothetical protein
VRRVWWAPPGFFIFRSGSKSKESPITVLNYRWNHSRFAAVHGQGRILVSLVPERRD